MLVAHPTRIQFQQVDVVDATNVVVRAVLSSAHDFGDQDVVAILVVVLTLDVLDVVVLAVVCYQCC